jgi:glycine cleavage system protein P-like pyridoxal-binding family
MYMQSAVMAGLKVVPVKSLQDGSLDLTDLREKAEKHKDNLAALMVRTKWNTCTHKLINDRR